MLKAKTVALLLTTFGPGCSATEAATLAGPLLRAARAEVIPPLLLASVVLVETGGSCRLDARRRERAGGVSCGPYQIYLPGVRATERRCERSAFGVDLGARRAARILRHGRRLCVEACSGPGVCRRGSPWYCPGGSWWGRYNPGSRRWAAAVRSTWLRLRGWAIERGIVDA
jgi:hypothetical protein